MSEIRTIKLTTPEILELISSLHIKFDVSCQLGRNLVIKKRLQPVVEALWNSLSKFERDIILVGYVDSALSAFINEMVGD